MAKKRRRTRLTETDRELIRAARENGQTLGEIATKFKVTRSYISQITSPTGGAPTAAYDRWKGRLLANHDVSQWCHIDNARRSALRIMCKALELAEYLRARADLDRLIVKIPPDEVDYGGGSSPEAWIPQAIIGFARERIAG